MKKLSVCLLLGAWLVSPTLAAPPEFIDGVAAIVNKRVITYGEVRKYALPAIYQLRRDYSGDELREKISTAQVDALNNLIDRALIVHEYEEKGYRLPDNIVDTQIDEVVANDFANDREAFIKTLEAEQMTMSEYRDQMRERIIIQAMRNHRLEQEVVISPHRIETYYNEHLEDYRVEDQIKLRMIYIKKSPPPPPTPSVEPAAPATQAGDTPIALAELEDEAADEEESKSLTAAVEEEPVAATGVTTPATEETAAAESPAPPPAPPAVDPQQELAEALLAKLDEGDSFESLAKVYSEAREAEQGGDWGWIGRDILMPQLSNEAFTLKPGEHSDLIETEDAYYILFVEDFRPTHVKPLTEVRAQIEKELVQEQRTAAQENWVKELRKNAYIRVF